MADPQAQMVFKRIILFNKLLPEAELDNILGESPEPVDAMKRLIDRKVLNAKQANDLYGIYTKQLEQVTGKAAGGPPAAAPPPNTDKSKSCFISLPSIPNDAAGAGVRAGVGATGGGTCT